MKDKDTEVFISYCWSDEYGQQDEEHKEKVRALADFLIKNGFDVILDVYKNQEETANEFPTMMHEAMTGSAKVLIVLSKGYKLRAEGMKGGVGDEYKMIIKEIDEKKNKFILFTFSSYDAPIKLYKRDTIIYGENDWENKLFSKLLDVSVYDIPQKGNFKPVVNKVSVTNIYSIANNKEISVSSKEIEDLEKIKKTWVRKLFFFQEEEAKIFDVEQKFSTQVKIKDIKETINKYENQINNLKSQSK